MKNNEKGFGAVEALLALLVICLVAFIGWFVWHNKSSKTTNPPTVTTNTAAQKTTPAPSQTSDTAVFKAPELGIKIINVPPALGDMNYAVNVNGTQPGTTYADFSTISLSNLDKGCSPTGHVSNNGTLAKHTGTYNSSTDLQGGSPDQFIKQLDGFWISYGHPQATCSDNAKAETLHQEQTKAFQALVSNPANIEAL